MEGAGSTQRCAGRQPVTWSPCSQQDLLSPPGSRSPTVPGWEPPAYLICATPGLVDLHLASQGHSLCPCRSLGLRAPGLASWDTALTRSLQFSVTRHRLWRFSGIS